MRRALVLFVVVSLVLPGCAFLKYHPDPDDPFRAHPLGMHIYNESKVMLSEADWNKHFTEITDGYGKFERCAGPIDSDILQTLKQIPLVIIPPKRIFSNETDDFEVYGYTLFDSIYMRHDRLTSRLVMHELIHEYLYLSGKYPMGDIFHSDDLFAKCGWDFLSNHEILDWAPRHRPAGLFGN